MIRIEKVLRRDAQAAWDIRNAAILHQCSGHYPMKHLAIWAGGAMPEGFADEVEKHFFVASHNGRIVGTGMIHLDQGKIDALYVHPDHMRQGIGTAMIAFLERIARCHGLKSLILESTLNAAAFYRSCGFTGEAVDTYASPRGVSLDCIPMYQPLTPEAPAGHAD